MPNDDTYPVSKTLKNQSLISSAKYEQWYEESVENPDKFWGNCYPTPCSLR
ncbi:hypothetical protein ACVITL_005767 [Rhizobium pisi]